MRNLHQTQKGCSPRSSDFRCEFLEKPAQKGEVIFRAKRLNLGDAKPASECNEEYHYGSGQFASGRACRQGRETQCPCKSSFIYDPTRGATRDALDSSFALQSPPAADASRRCLSVRRYPFSGCIALHVRNRVDCGSLYSLRSGPLALDDRRVTPNKDRHVFAAQRCHPAALAAG